MQKTGMKDYVEKSPAISPNPATPAQPLDNRCMSSLRQDQQVAIQATHRSERNNVIVLRH